MFFINEVIIFRLHFSRKLYRTINGGPVTQKYAYQIKFLAEQIVRDSAANLASDHLDNYQNKILKHFQNKIQK